jgi:glycine/D-amino acid oxidase-like deaminating enzyme
MVTFGWTNANEKLPRQYYDLNVAGMRAYTALRGEFGATPWWHEGGSVEWPATGGYEEQAGKLDRLRAWGYAVHELSPKQLADMEPDLDLATIGDAPIANFPEEGWLEAVPYAHAMLEAAARYGATVRCGSRVTHIERCGNRVVGVRTAGGGTCTADLVVNCAGRWADEVASLAGLRHPLKPTVGLLVYTQPAPTCLRRVIRTPQCHMRPDGAGRVVLHMDDADQTVSIDTEPSPSLRQAQDLVRRAAIPLPALRGVRPEAARIALRPIPADDLYSAVGMMPGIEGYYVVVTHGGATLAAYLGSVVAREILRGHHEPGLEAFRPGRFVTAA